MNWLWEIPWMRDATGLTGTLLGGWQVNGITALQSGFPFSVFTSAAYPTGDYNGDGVNNDRPNTPSFGTELPNDDRQAYINGLFVAPDFPRPDDARRSPAERLSRSGLREHRPVAVQELRDAEVARREDSVPLRGLQRVQPRQPPAAATATWRRAPSDGRPRRLLHARCSLRSS